MGASAFVEVRGPGSGALRAAVVVTPPEGVSGDDKLDRFAMMGVAGAVRGWITGACSSPWVGGRAGAVRPLPARAGGCTGVWAAKRGSACCRWVTAGRCEDDGAVVMGSCGWGWGSWAGEGATAFEEVCPLMVPAPS